MTPASQILWRNRRRLDASQPLLLLNAPADEFAARLRQEGGKPEALCLSFKSHTYIEGTGAPSGFGLQPQGGGRWSQIVLFQPREKALLEMLLDLCRSLLSTDGVLWLAGENKSGIKSAGKRLDIFFSDSSRTDNARHCTLFCTRGPLNDQAFELDPYISQWPLELGDRTLTIGSLPGVFAHGRLDPGTRLLLEALTGLDAQKGVSGRVLDFACGCGAVGIALAAKQPDIDVVLLDDSALALESARRSMDANGQAGTLIASDGLSELLRGQSAPFDWIVSNPPFHAGVNQQLDVAKQFFRDCPHLMTDKARLCLVANAHLPYESWLSELFGQVQVIAADREYNVWLAEKARKK